MKVDLELMNSLSRKGVGNHEIEICQGLIHKTRHTLENYLKGYLKRMKNVCKRFVSVLLSLCIFLTSANNAYAAELRDRSVFDHAVSTLIAEGSDNAVTVNDSLSGESYRLEEAGKATASAAAGATAGYVATVATGMVGVGMVGNGAGIGAAAGPVGAAVGALVGLSLYAVYHVFQD